MFYFKERMGLRMKMMTTMKRTQTMMVGESYLFVILSVMMLFWLISRTNDFVLELSYMEKIIRLMEWDEFESSKESHLLYGLPSSQIRNINKMCLA